MGFVGFWCSLNQNLIFSSEDIILRIERNTMKFLLPTHFLLALSTPLMSAVGRGVKFNLQVQNMYDLFFVFILILFSLSRSLLRLHIIWPFRRRRLVTRSRFFSHLAPFLILSSYPFWFSKSQDSGSQQNSHCGDVEGIGTEDRGRNLDGCADQW